MVLTSIGEISVCRPVSNVQSEYAHTPLKLFKDTKFCFLPANPRKTYNNFKDNRHSQKPLLTQPHVNHRDRTTPAGNTDAGMEFLS